MCVGQCAQTKCFSASINVLQPSQCPSTFTTTTTTCPEYTADSLQDALTEPCCRTICSQPTHASPLRSSHFRATTSIALPSSLLLPPLRARIDFFHYQCKTCIEQETPEAKKERYGPIHGSMGERAPRRTKYVRT